ncbi:methyl-accepting chemotaxis protein [Pontibacillus marinus]|uniref:Methyl-accepting chemotaxis protein n=1 Tax=Pontibacillus marinus BH030004 = DSM 16465 TaxID=1385511 RepID=A0A0A5I578_9BACI|nr:methyl-accepting chemotaxis protein [Pontibacillus marinus]KGX90977.1 methyl-accepting chemotaxis protein [Pontibacillus marinus BH030004 = DSM 16465]
MNKFKWRNLKLGTKYVVAFTVSILLFIVAGYIIFTQVDNIQEDLAALERRGDRSIAITEMGSLIRTKDVRASDYIHFKDEMLINEFQSRREKFNTFEEDVRGKMDTKKQQDLFNQIASNDKKMNEMFLNKLVPAVDQNNDIRARQTRQEISNLRAETVDKLKELRAIVNEDREQAITEVKDSLKQTIIVLVSSIIASAVVGIVLISIVNRLVQTNLNKVVHVASEISNGNLQTEEIEYNGNDEIGKLASAINEMKDSLKRLIKDVSTATEMVSSQSEELTQSANEVKEGSEQIASTMQELSSGSETQANSSTNLSEIMDGFVQKIQHAQQNGDQVAQTSNEVLNMTGEGSTLMNQSVEQMSNIDQLVKDSVSKVQGLDEQSKEISKLIQVINDIAEQTNLLSLNAAIEAARAGEHGKGFAVVADEVRKLAEQVSHSVGDITKIVTNIQNETDSVVQSLQNGYEQVDEGSKQIQVTGETFESIQQSVTDMASKVQQISGNLNEISNESNDMNASIQEIASVSEESAAGVEEAATSAQQSSSSMEEVSASSNELAQLAEQLNEQVRKFKL